MFKKYVDNMQSKYDLDTVRKVANLNYDTFLHKYEKQIDEVIETLGIHFTEERREEVLKKLFNDVKSYAFLPNWKLDKKAIKNVVIAYHRLDVPNPYWELIWNLGLGVGLFVGMQKLTEFLYGGAIMSDFNSLIVFLTYAIIVYGTYKNSKAAHSKIKDYDMHFSVLNMISVE